MSAEEQATGAPGAHPEGGARTDHGVRGLLRLQELDLAIDRLRNRLAGLESAHGFLQSRIARELTLKRTPQLSFEYDATVERGVRMGKLIDELVHDAPADEPD